MAPRVTEEYRKATHEGILDAAETLFSDKGYHETSMDDIVSESGLSKGAIYGHFESKEKLFLAVQQRKLDARLGKMESVFSAEDSATTKLRKALDSSFSDDCTMSREACLMNLEILFAAARMESSRADMEKRATSSYRFWREILKEGIKSGEFTKDVDPELVAPILDAAVDGLSIHWMIGHDFDWPKMKDAFLKLVTKGLLKNG